MRHARHIVLVGPMGAGKSHLGRLLAVRMGLAFVDLDAAIEAAAGQSINALFAAEGEAGFREREARALADAFACPPAVIATGGGAVLAEANRAAMREHGRVVYLSVDPATQLARVSGSSTRPLLKATDPAARLAALQAIREPLYREVADLVFDTTSLSPEAAADALAARLAMPEDLPA